MRSHARGGTAMRILPTAPSTQPHSSTGLTQSTARHTQRPSPSATTTIAWCMRECSGLALSSTCLTPIRQPCGHLNPPDPKWTAATSAVWSELFPSKTPPGHMDRLAVSCCCQHWSYLLKYGNESQSSSSSSSPVREPDISMTVDLKKFFLFACCLFEYIDFC